MQKSHNTKKKYLPAIYKKGTITGK